jgi:hypothetical protein
MCIIAEQKGSNERKCLVDAVGSTTANNDNVDGFVYKSACKRISLLAHNTKTSSSSSRKTEGRT